MNYELAKQLKDAGFPGSQHWDILEAVGDWSTLRHGRFPTLSKLIEACGDRFGGLSPERHIETGNILSWIAEDESEILEVGKTPEEAVAKLWLVIHRKSPENK